MEEAASQLERDHVHSVYEKVAPHFSDSRYKAWPKVRQFLLEQEPGSIIADVGCGNGRYLNINEEVFKLGCDVCQPLVEAARCQGHEVQVCDGLRLPYRQGCFDAILSIAVIHHLSTKERRIRAIKEMARTLRVGGRLMIYVWAMEQKRRKFEKQDVFIPWNPNPPAAASSSRKARRKAIGTNCRIDGGDDKHRKAKSTSSMVDEEEVVTTAHQNTRSRWSFSRSLDSVLDFGGLAVSRPSVRELNKSCSDGGELDGPRVSRRTRGVELLRQFSGLFSFSRNNSEDDVFSSSTDLGDRREKANHNSGTPEMQGSSAAIVNDCGSMPLPDLVPHQRERSIGMSSGEHLGSDGVSSQWQGTDECLGEGKEEVKAIDSYLRYYHVFREGELLELIENHVEELHILQNYFDHANWCVVAEKVQIWKI